MEKGEDTDGAIVVVHAEALVRSGLCAWLQGHCTEVVVADGRPALERALTTGRRVKAVVLQVDAALDRTLDMVRWLARAHRTTAVLVLGELREKPAMHLEQAGVRALLPTGVQQEELVHAVHTVVRGWRHCNEPMACALRSRVNEARPTGKGRYTARELEVLRYFADRYTCRQIGDLLGICHRTVEKHRDNLFKKAGVSHREDLVRKARREGWL